MINKPSHDDSVRSSFPGEAVAFSEAPDRQKNIHYAISFSPTERFLGAKDVQALLGITKAGLYKLMADEPSFPRPIRIGKRRVAWLESEIIIYLNSRIAERNSKYGYDKNKSAGGQP